MAWMGRPGACQRARGVLFLIFARKVALQEASRRAFPHIYEEIALQEASRRAFPHIYEENPPIPAVVFFFGAASWGRVLVTFAQL